MQTSSSTRHGDGQSRTRKWVSALAWVALYSVVIAAGVIWVTPRVVTTGVVLPQEAPRLPLVVGVWAASVLVLIENLARWVWAAIDSLVLRRAALSTPRAAGLLIVWLFVLVVALTLWSLGAAAAALPQSTGQVWPGAPIDALRLTSIILFYPLSVLVLKIRKQFEVRDRG